MSSDIQFIPINQIVLSDDALQMRAGGTDYDFVDTLTEIIRTGENLTPCILFYDAEQDVYFVGDGWHRCNAYRMVYSENANVPATIREGGRAAAFHFALSANADQIAKPRTRKDVRKAVLAAIETYMLGPDALKNTKFVFSADRKKKATQIEIAEMCRCTQQTVSNILKEIKASAKASDISEDDEPIQTPKQLDFWERFQLDTIEIANSVKAVLQDKTRWELMEQEPEKAAEALDTYAQTLAQEVKSIKKAARDIRTGIKASK